MRAAPQPEAQRSFFHRATVLLLAALGFAAVAAPKAEAGVFDPETFTLDNGLKVIVVTNRRAPIVTHMIWYRVGAADEAPGESGLAHFLEHLMFKGTKNTEPGEFTRIVAENGGVQNAFTSYDYTAYFQTVARDRLEIMMRYEADRMTNLQLTDEIVDPERQVVLEERRSRVGNNPSSQLWEQANATLFLNHPYRVPVIGWEHEIKQLSTEGALAFYRKWYAPNNAVLVVAGDVTAEDVRPLAEKYYGPIAPADIPERARVAEPPHNTARSVTLESPRVSQPAMSVSFLAPSYNRGASEHAYALQVLDEILGSGTTSRLYRALVVEQKLAARAGSGYDASSFDLSSFRVSASPRLGVDMADLEEALRAEIAKLLADGVTAEEVAAAQQRLKALAIYARDDLGTGARVFGSALTTGSTVEDVEAWPERIDAVTAEQVNAAARAVFRDDHSVTSYLLPDSTS